MRLAETAILLILVLACIRSNNAVSKSSFFLTPFDHYHHNVGKRMRGSSANGRVLGGAAANFREFCKSKGHQFYDFFFHSKNTTSDSKRVVPTGPNPLHNREELDEISSLA
ncbi:unnamed protein product [Malus baccata var. baccata]